MSENAFAPPAEPVSATPALYSPLTVVLCALLFTPLVAGLALGLNHWRAGDAGRGALMALSGCGGFLLLGLLGAVPEPFQGPALLIAVFGMTYAWYRDAAALKARHPGAAPASVLYLISFGVALILLLWSLPGLYWIVTGDPTFRPVSMGAPSSGP